MIALARQVRLFHDVLEYTRRFRPKLVICENVAGLLKRNRGCEPQIHAVRMAFDELGYSFAYTQLDAKNLFCLSDARESGCGLFCRT